jgi:hypothetical protein
MLAVDLLPGEEVRRLGIYDQTVKVKNDCFYHRLGGKQAVVYRILTSAWIFDMVLGNQSISCQ